MLLTIVELKGNDWQRDFRALKKKLRTANIPYTVKKEPRDSFLYYSLCSEPEYIDEARNIAAEYYAMKPEVIKRNRRVNQLATELGQDWFYIIIAMLIHFPRKYPFWTLIVLILLASQIFWVVVSQ